MKTKVIFRTFTSDSSVIALFPEVPADSWGGHCMSYQHVGQHGAASVDLSHCTRRSTPEEIAPLLRELEGIGYKDLAPVSRVTRDMNLTRRLAAV